MGLYGPAVSLVVCTRDRADLLARLLEDLLALQRCPATEIVVVDNGSTDGTAALVESFARRSALPVVCSYEPVVGLGRARNRGLTAARAPLVAFVDDDCRVAPDHPARVVAAFAGSPSLAFVAGSVLGGGGDQAAAALVERRRSRWFLPGSVLRCGDVMGANLAVAARAVETIGGFDVALGAGTPFRCEDADLCARLLAAGWCGRYVASLGVLHAHRRDHNDAVALEAANDRARGAFLLRRLAGGAWRYGPDWLAQLAARVGPSPSRLRWAATVTLREIGGGLGYVGRRAGERAAHLRGGR